jgi:hypothetical protein
MKKLKLSKGTYKAVFIKWYDSMSVKQVWWNLGDLIDEVRSMEEGDYFYTLAYLVMENKNSYIFANSIHFEDKKVISFGKLFTIPKGCVEYIKPVNIK